MKIILNKIDKLIVIIFIIILFFLVLKSTISDYKIIAHNKEVYKWVPKELKEYLSMDTSLYTFCAMMNEKNKGYIDFLRTSNGLRYHEGQPYSSFSLFYPVYLDKETYLDVSYESIILYNVNLYGVIEQKNIRYISYISNIEDDLKNKGDYFFYIICTNKDNVYSTQSDEWNGGNVKLCKYRIVRKKHIICEDECTFIAPAGYCVNDYFNPRSFLFKEINGVFKFYIALSKNDNKYSQKLFEYNKENKKFNEIIDDIECIFYNSVNDADIYYAKKYNSKYGIFKDEKLITQFDDMILYGRVLNSKEVYVLLRQNPEIYGNDFNFVQGKLYEQEQAYIYNPKTNEVFPFYLLSYSSFKWDKDNLSIFIRGFVRPYCWNIIPYK